MNSISITTGSDDEASIYKVIVVTFVIKKSGVFAIEIEATYNCWGGGDRNEKLDLVIILSPPVTTTSSP